MIPVGLYRPVHVKTLRSQKLRMLLTHRTSVRKLLGEYLGQRILFYGIKDIFLASSSLHRSLRQPAQDDPTDRVKEKPALLSVTGCCVCPYRARPVSLGLSGGVSWEGGAHEGDRHRGIRGLFSRDCLCGL